ncbi:hypothetical protein [Mesorhizobium sp. M0118]|uniref:hypothetical protein n=1 Tax=Mesorhizobium sp. M0118 TaxID=2956884 RepID=UPI0033363C89
MGAARERGVVDLADGIFQIRADVVPALTESELAGTAEDTIGKVGRAEAGEPDQPLLLLACGRALIGLDLGGEPDRSDVVAGPILPATGQPAIAGKMKVQSMNPSRLRRRLHGCNRRRDRRRRGRIGIIFIARPEVSREGRDAEAKSGRNGRAAEQVDGKGVVMSHGKSPWI